MTELSVWRFIRSWGTSSFAHLTETPWRIIADAERHVREALHGIDADYHLEGDVAVHRTATIEAGAVLKGPALIGPSCFVASGAYLRGGVFLEEHCIIGPNAELKTSLIFRGSKLAHLNFVGDSILGSDVNIEAGAIIANYRNERDEKRIRILHEGHNIDAGCEKFGALLGDGVRIGANAVIAPGAILQPGVIVPRLGLVDQAPVNG